MAKQVTDKFDRLLAAMAGPNAQIPELTKKGEQEKNQKIRGKSKDED